MREVIYNARIYSPDDFVCERCKTLEDRREDRRLCRDCHHVKTEGAILNDYCFLYSEPLALRVAVPSGEKKLIRTAKCCQEFIGPPRHVPASYFPSWSRRFK